MFLSQARLPITQRLVLSFLGVIALGTCLLSLPIVRYSGVPYPGVINTLFNVVSMVCVTGLNTYSIGLTYNGLGQVISMLLIQIGGLGLVTLVALSFYAIRRRLNLYEQMLLKSAMTYDSSRRLKQYLFRVYKVTFVAELIVALFFMIDFIPRFGWRNGLFNSLFFAVSAFCNAGFDNLPSTTSLIGFQLNPIVNFGVMFLIIAGGLGFPVWTDLAVHSKKILRERPIQWRALLQGLRPHTRLILKTTAIILIVGTALTWLSESHNPKTIGNLPFWQQGLVSLFQTVTMRTAGFATIDYSQAQPVTNFLYMLQMIMGGGPGGTAGGVKLAVIAITILIIRSELQGQSHVTFQKRVIPAQTLRQTLTILIFFIGVLLSGYVLLLAVEPHLDPFRLGFESVSAIATVGVTIDTTTHLSIAGKWIIMALMFIGRVGPTTVLMALLQNKEKEIHYPTTEIILG